MRIWDAMVSRCLEAHVSTGLSPACCLNLARLCWLAVQDAAASMEDYICCCGCCMYTCLPGCDLHNWATQGFQLTQCGIASQALPLRCLELGEDIIPDEDEDGKDSSADDLPCLDPGCFPDFSAMPCLQQLKLSGQLVLESEHLWQQGTAGSASLQVLELHDVGEYEFPEAFQMLSRCPALTRLNYHTCEQSDGAAMADPLAANTFSAHTQLQHLDITAFDEVPWLTRLSALTCLELHCPYHTAAEVVEENLRVVGSLASVQKLRIHALLRQPSSRRVCVEALGKLPLLEDVELEQGGDWSEDEVLQLLPPPASMKRMRLSTHDRAGWRCWGPAAIDQFASYGLDIALT
jgi:hypothetical protein